MDVPDDADMSKVLFNHSQDCEVDSEYEECTHCNGDGMIENPDYDTENLADESDDDLDEFIDCIECDASGIVKTYKEDITECDHQHAPNFICYHPHQVGGSMFCFDGTKEGVKNLKAILPIIEECGCSWSWTKKGDHRIEIGW
jgi:hypothetical protein